MIVRCERTNKKYAIITQNLYDQVRPVLQWCMAKADGSRDGTAQTQMDILDLILAGLKLRAGMKTKQ